MHTHDSEIPLPPETAGLPRLHEEDCFSTVMTCKDKTCEKETLLSQTLQQQT